MCKFTFKIYSCENMHLASIFGVWIYVLNKFWILINIFRFGLNLDKYSFIWAKKIKQNIINIFEFGLKHILIPILLTRPSRLLHLPNIASAKRERNRASLHFRFQGGNCL